MGKYQKIKSEKEIGKSGYVNKNCWLAKNLNYPPSKRCQYCELRFNKCLFERYLVITLVLVCLLLLTSYLAEKSISKPLIVSIFVLIIVYGYFFNKSTESIIEANFAEKKSRESFEELSETLQQKVDEQTKDIKEAYEVEKQAHEQLKRLDEAKTNFILVTQHHLRTPLSVTMGYLDLLLNGTYGKIPSKVIKAINKAEESVKKEIGVVNDLLNVSQFQLGRVGILPRDSVLIEETLKEIVGDLKLEADSKGIYLKFECSDNIPAFKADKNQLKMALTNIVDNAVKYTKQGGVAIKLKIENEKIKIEVKDTGIGVMAEDQKDLFDKAFQRSKEAWSANAIGKGIGLYLSAQIIRAHGGKIWVESMGKDKGSVFYIELPTNNNKNN